MVVPANASDYWRSFTMLTVKIQCGQILAHPLYKTVLIKPHKIAFECDKPI